MDTFERFLPWIFGLFGLVVVGNVLLQLSDRLTLMRAIKHLLAELPKSIDAVGRQWDRDREAAEDRITKMWHRNVYLAAQVAARDRENADLRLSIVAKAPRVKRGVNGHGIESFTRFAPREPMPDLNEADSLLAGQHEE